MITMVMRIKHLAFVPGKYVECLDDAEIGVYSFRVNDKIVEKTEDAMPIGRIGKRTETEYVISLPEIALREDTMGIILGFIATLNNGELLYDPVAGSFKYLKREK